jgi:hypothetical protein
MIRPTEIFRFKDPYITSASGLCVLGDTLYLVADDDNALFSWKNGKCRRLTRVSGELPEDPVERKKVKPDFESLTNLGSTLILLPSFSKPHRNQVILVESKTFQAQVKALPRVERYLAKNVPDLNLEGAFIKDDLIYFLQRGNGENGQNALICLDHEAFFSDQVKDFKVVPVNLGKSKSSPLAFTDSFLDGDRILFLAVAEETTSTYDDGEFKGAILGVLDLQGNLKGTHTLHVPHKPEGLVRLGNKLYVVTDADDRSIPSCLYAFDWPQDLFDD